MLFLLGTDALWPVFLDVAWDVVGEMLCGSSESLSMVESVARIDQLAALQGSEPAALIAVPRSEPDLRFFSESVKVVLASDHKHVPDDGDADLKAALIEAVVKQLHPNLDGKRVVLLDFVGAASSISKGLGTQSHFEVLDVLQGLFGNFEFVDTDDALLIVMIFELLRNEKEVVFRRNVVADVRRV